MPLDTEVNHLLRNIIKEARISYSCIDCSTEANILISLCICYISFNRSMLGDVIITKYIELIQILIKSSNRSVSELGQTFNQRF